MLGQQDGLLQFALEIGEQGHQGGRRAGRAADGHDLGPDRRRQGGGADDGGGCGGCGRGRCGPAQGLDLGGKFAREFVSPDQTARLGLGHIVGGPGLQRLQADAGVAPRQGRGHDHLHVRLALQDQGQGGQAVHDRHFDVQHHHVDRGPRQFRQRRLAVGRPRHDAERRVALQDLDDQTAHDGAVVHDHDANAAVLRGRGGGVRQGDLSSRLRAVHNSKL
ncbi:hypothetical protein D3C86_1436020 [compost metagenome]